MKDQKGNLIVRYLTIDSQVLSIQDECKEKDIEAYLHFALGYKPEWCPLNRMSHKTVQMMYALEYGKKDIIVTKCIAGREKISYQVKLS